MNTQLLQQYVAWWSGPDSEELADILADLPPTGQTDRDRQKAMLAFFKHRDALPICPRLALTEAVMRLALGNSSDVIFRSCDLGDPGRSALLVCLDGLAKREYVMPVLESLTVRLRHEALPTEPNDLQNFLVRRMIIAVEVSPMQAIGQALSAMLCGDSVLFVDGLGVGIRCKTRGFEHRKPDEPTAEPVVRGPKVGFTEVLSVNLGLVRQILQDERLRIQTQVIGTRSNTQVALFYMVGLTLPELVQEARSRLDRVQIDGVLETGYLEELISDTTLTPFPLVKSTERPDVVAAELLEGKVAIMADGSPHAMVVPTTFSAGMQAAEDYYQRWPSASFTRLLRYLYLFIALLGPSVYIAVLTFHHEMVPTNLLLSIMRGREGVPFPAVVEALIMELSFEILREAGVRLPKPVGQTVSIVGALVIGEEAVRAGLVSPAMVMVVALTGISSFVIPLYSSALGIRLLRFPMMLLASVLGFYGIVIGLLALSVHLATLRSFGVPYMSPTMPPTWADMKDLMIRAPWWALRKRPKLMPVVDRVRQRERQAPGPNR